MPENGSGSTWGGRIPMATCRTRNPNATAAPWRVPGASAGGERGSSAPPPIRRRGKEVEEKCPHRHSAPASRQRRLRTFERPGLPVQTGDAAPKWSVRRSATSAASASPPAGRRRLRTDRSSLWFASTLGVLRQRPATLWPVGSLLSPKAPPGPPCQPLCRSALKCKLWAPRPQILAQGEQG